MNYMADKDIFINILFSDGKKKSKTNNSGRNIISMKKVICELIIFFLRKPEYSDY